ncbi:MAG: bifunctional diaminohydroxyphosphoribosylaminopyrimidine deaminase/5-amino-6-(5-phosphoribosylamino)uracil reductase RibD [Proteobacteria bacterium]|nr:bifunctional diaminohydroxyphosphoribosylaminopyrimidine deaminase/5-amino-6-(5-phosphoribosylamino)uracil reductase RibD [Pseudomonadota bacterium]
MTAEPTDLRHMRHALRLARRALGTVAPNPAVGCVIVSPGGRVVGRGWTQAGGRPHAETVALSQAGALARGATAYVTLEPCSHHGKTPPCAAALIAAGIARVVAAVEDPDPRVKGKGFSLLRDAGIYIITPVMEKEAASLNEGFFLKVREDRPLVTLKVAQSADGKTAVAPTETKLGENKLGENKWITGEAARRFGHLLRAQHDAILVGIGTALADDPDLTCRIDGLEWRSPIRIVLDGKLQLKESSKLARSARNVPTIVFTTSEGGDALKALGIDVARVVPDVHGRPDIFAVLRALALRGVTRLLVEGGATVHSAFLERGIADRLEIFRSPTVLGAKGHGTVDALSALDAGNTSRFVHLCSRKLGPDVLESFAVRA